MKKILTLIFAVICAVGATAKDYVSNIAVIANGMAAESSRKPIEVTEKTSLIGKKTYTLALKDFSLVTGGTKLEIGDIEVTGIKSSVDADGNTVLYVKKTIFVSIKFLEGATLPVPIELNGTINKDDVLEVRLDIALAGQKKQFCIICVFK